MNALDRIIASIAPEWGVRRVGARQLLDAYSRAYAAAKHGRRNRGWSGRSSSANSEVGSSLRELRNRSREFVRDSWAGQRMLDVLVSHAVGTGIVSVANTGSDRADNQVKHVIQEWAEVADIEGVLDWPGIQALALRSMIEGGDSVVRFMDLSMAEANGTVPFRLLGLEGDQIDNSRDGAPGSKSRLGVELGEHGRRLGLWLHEEHPGEYSARPGASSNLVEWQNLAHLYKPLRFGQVRGIPVFAPILLTAREMQDIVEATLVKMRTEASFAGFIKRTSGGVSPFAAKQDATGDKITRIEPGMIADIGDGEITFANPSSQTAFGEVFMSATMAMAAGAGITYDQLTGDLRQANYSSLRAGKIEFRRLIEQTQWTVLIPRLIAPVTRRLIDRAILSGKLKPRREGYRLDYITPAVEPIDPKKDLEADIIAVRAGRLSPQEFIAAWGRDWREVVADTAAFMEFLDKQGSSGLALDIDARRPWKGVNNVQQTKAESDD